MGEVTAGWMQPSGGRMKPGVGIREQPSGGRMKPCAGILEQPRGGGMEPCAGIRLSQVAAGWNRVPGYRRGQVAVGWMWPCAVIWAVAKWQPDETVYRSTGAAMYGVTAAIMYRTDTGGKDTGKGKGREAHGK